MSASSSSPSTPLTPTPPSSFIPSIPLISPSYTHDSDTYALSVFNGRGAYVAPSLYTQAHSLLFVAPGNSEVHPHALARILYVIKYRLADLLTHPPTSTDDHRMKGNGWDKRGGPRLPRYIALLKEAARRLRENLKAGHSWSPLGRLTTVCNHVSEEVMRRAAEQTVVVSTEGEEMSEEEKKLVDRDEDVDSEAEDGVEAEEEDEDEEMEEEDECDSDSSDDSHSCSDSRSRSGRRDRERILSYTTATP